MPPRTITPELWSTIRDRTRPPASNDEQRWYIIWDTLFPTLPRPSSPYLELEPNRPKSTHEVNYIMRGIFSEFERLISNSISPPANVPPLTTAENTQRELCTGSQPLTPSTLLPPSNPGHPKDVKDDSVHHGADEKHSRSYLNSSAELSDAKHSPLDIVYLDADPERSGSEPLDTISRSTTESPCFDNTPPGTQQSPGSPATSDSEAEAELEEYTSESSPASESSQETVDEIFEARSIVASTHQDIVNLTIDRVIERFWAIVDQDLGTELEDGAESPEQRNASSNPARRGQNGSVPAQRGQKRGRDPNDEFGEEDDGRGEAPSLPSRSEPAVQHVKEFGCPFRKHSPLKYTLKSHRVCAMNSWPNISRLKEHLYRNHIMPLYCQRCWVIFDTEAQLDSHKLLPRAEMCEVRPGQPLDGITPAQVKELKSRKKRSRCQTEASRWRDIYRLLFPGDQVPSPYFEELEELGFVRREMPRLVRESLQQVAEQQSGRLEQALIQALPQLVRECLDKLERSMQGHYPEQTRLVDSNDQSAQPNAVHEATDNLRSSVSGASKQGVTEPPSLEETLDPPVKKSPGDSETGSQLTPQAPSDVPITPTRYGSPSYTTPLQQDSGVNEFESPTSFFDQFDNDNELGYDKNTFCVGGCAGHCVCWY
ncbi:hypothetical protein GQ53DRAFT_843119 [Thozetella sp. PMI_491]|nr:hypothetical protein GQ53DRAFT_843119 [Thozetella sp. PMI_491]